MDLGINREEARLISDSLSYFFSRTAVPDLLLEMYPGADLKGVLDQLEIIKQIGEKPNEYFLKEILEG